MTREQRLELLKQIEKDIYVPSIESTFLDDAKSCAIHLVIEELEQEPILDKVRAEMVELTKCPYGTECLGANCPSNTDCMICGEHVLEIIDKYKAESEGKND